MPGTRLRSIGNTKSSSTSSSLLGAMISAAGDHFPARNPDHVSKRKLRFDAHRIKTYSESHFATPLIGLEDSMFTKFCFATLMLGGTAMAAQISSPSVTFNKDV